MTTPEYQDDPFIDALRASLPSEQDERRVRARLLAAGVIVAGVAGPATAAAAGGVAGTSLLPKVAGLSWVSKVGLATVVATASVGVPLSLELASRAPETPPPAVAPSKPQPPSRLAALPPERSAAEAPSEPVLPSEPVPSELVPSEPQVVLPAAPTQAVAGAPPSGRKAPAQPSPVAAANAGPSVAALPALEEPATAERRADGTLREETELVERALYALKQGDRASARHWLDQHARRFPNGLLTRERERALARLEEAAPAR